MVAYTARTVGEAALLRRSKTNKTRNAHSDCRVTKSDRKDVADACGHVWRRSKHGSIKVGQPHTGVVTYTARTVGDAAVHRTSIVRKTKRAPTATAE